jgi:hypothetical protein
MESELKKHEPWDKDPHSATPCPFLVIKVAWKFTLSIVTIANEYVPIGTYYGDEPSGSGVK